MNPPEEPTQSTLLANPWLRLILYVGLGYVGLVLMLVFFENQLVFPATTFAQHWQRAPDSGIQDVDLTIADGTKIHAWWWPHPDSDQALLFFHGNGGNLSHRGEYILRLRKTLRTSVARNLPPTGPLSSPR